MLWIYCALGLVSGDRETIEKFVAAFNHHDPQAMVDLCHDEVVWFSVVAEKMAPEAKGKQALLEGMQSYFKAVPSVKSVLMSLYPAGPFFHGVERASWEKDGKRVQQCSLTVYEMRDGKIQRVWYFPAFQCD